MSAPKRGNKQNLLTPQDRLLIERFLKAQAEHGLCPRYLQNQESHLGAFHRYLEWEHLSLREVKSEDVRRFLVFVVFSFQMLYGRCLTSGAMQCWKFTLGEYFLWLKDEKAVDSDPTRHPDSPKRWECKLRQVPLPDFVQRLLAMPDEHTYAGMRDQAIFGLAATVGLSNSDLANLTLKCLDLPNHRLKVCPMKFKYAREERWVPLEPQVQRMLERYLAYTRPAWLKDPTLPAVFLMRDGRPLARHSVIEIFHHYSEKLGAKGLNCRMMKNVAALYQLRYCGRTLEELMRLFGQSNIRHMREYLAFLPEERRRAATKKTRYHWLINDMKFQENELLDHFKNLKERFAKAGSTAGEEDAPGTSKSRVETQAVGV